MNSANALFLPSEATLTIVDDDFSGGRFNFSQSNYDVNESGGAVTVTAQCDGGNSGAVSVQYSTVAPTFASNSAPVLSRAVGSGWRASPPRFRMGSPAMTGANHRDGDALDGTHRITNAVGSLFQFAIASGTLASNLVTTNSARAYVKASSANTDFTPLLNQQLGWADGDSPPDLYGDRSERERG